METFSFEKLHVYQGAMTLVKQIYAITKSFPQYERYALCDQLNRAIVSVPSNIAESSGRTSYKEKIKFIGIAYGSLMEAYCQLQIAHSVGYLAEENINILKPHFQLVANQLNALSKSYSKQLNLPKSQEQN